MQKRCQRVALGRPSVPAEVRALLREATVSADTTVDSGAIDSDDSDSDRTYEVNEE